MVGAMADDAIVPDTKDWTWVLRERCPECGLTSADVDVRTLPVAIPVQATHWEAVLSRPEVRVRPAPAVWSALEYACHVRDVYRLFDQRVHLMLDEDEPTFANWDQDETAVTGRYGEQDPAAVAVELREGAERIAATFAQVPDDAWARRGFRSNGDGFTIETLAQYMVHDVVHHLHDVRG